jgi:hypothetical protein
MADLGNGSSMPSDSLAQLLSLEAGEEMGAGTVACDSGSERPRGGGRRSAGARAEVLRIKKKEQRGGGDAELKERREIFFSCFNLFNRNKFIFFKKI